MRHYLIATSLLLAACSYDPSNGDASFHPQLLSRPVWDMTQQNANGPVRFCQISAGELNVALKFDGSRLKQQVNINNELLTGQTYNVQIGSHHYDTGNSWFSGADSDAIVQDMLSGSDGYVYTELFNMRSPNHDMRANNSSSKIPLAGFSGQYQACKAYMAGK